MASVQEQLKLKRAPTDVWNVKEQLCLASSVLKSGDQNWMSVSRSLKLMVDKDSTRPPDWFSQKSCAQQYAYLLENLDIPRRKKRESGETISELIVRRLTEDRIAELQKTISTQKEEYTRLKNEVLLLRNGTISEDKLKKMWQSIQEEENKKLIKSEVDKSAGVSNNCQMGKESLSLQDSGLKSVENKISQDTLKTQDVTVVNNEDQDKKPKPKSSLLTSLLESKNPASQIQMTQVASAVTKVNESNSSSKDSNKLDNSLQIKKSANIIPIEDRPSSSAPTLSKLLEQPSACNQKIVQQQLKISSNVTSPKTLSDSSKSPSTPKTRLAPTANNETEITKSPESVTELQSSSSDILETLPDSNDQIFLKTEKEINSEMTDDFPITIKEEENITDLKSSEDMVKVEIKDNVSIQSPSNLTEDQSRDKKIDSSSSSKFSEGEISFSEIDSSSKNIAEIIGTSIESIQPDINLTKSSDETEKMSNNSSIESFTSEESKSPRKEETDKGPKLISETVSDISTQELDSSDNDKSQTQNILEDVEKMDTSESVTKKDSPKPEEKILVENSESTKSEKVSSSSSGQATEKLSKDLDSKLQSKSKNEKEDLSSNKLTKSNKITENKKNIQNTSIEKCSSETESINKKQSDYTKQGSKVSKNIGDDSNTVVSSDSKLLNLNKEIKTEPIDESECIKTETRENKNNQDTKNIKKCESEDDKKDFHMEKVKITEESENQVIKEETIESTENLDDEEPTLSKLSGGRAMKTYSKKHNASLDSEPEIDTGGETADYRAWKKSIMLIYNKLATHKYASKFLKPITEDQAPGYHSIIFKPMDLGSIKKNIDNGTIRTTSHFTRDVMLMFQNAIMFNKHQTHVHKMTVEMQDDYLAHLQVLTRASGESSFRRETRTAANFSSDSFDTGLKRKWSHNTSLHDSDSPRLKKRRKSEND